MKECGNCKEILALDCFNKNKAKKDGLQTWCRACSNAKSRTYYSDNAPIMRKQITAAQKIRIAAAYAFVNDYKEKTPCKDCESFFPSYVMDFDHILEKNYNVSELVHGGWSIATITKEIESCDLVCANCHRIRTHDRNKGLRTDSSPMVHVW